MVPGINTIPGPPTRFNLAGALQPYEIQYLNLVHWMYHKLKQENTLNYINTLNLSINHKGQNIPITDWNLMHTFVGDIFPNSPFVSGMHFDHPALTNFYNYKNRYIVHPANKQNRKVSRLFPKNWDTLKCAQKAVQAIKNQNKHVSKQNNVVRIKTIVDGIPMKIIIKLINNPNQPITGKIISFYPLF